MGEYIYDASWAEEKHRLDALAALYDEGTFDHLRHIGAASSSRWLEVGAGSGTVAAWLADRVGPDGHVLAIDIDTRFVEALHSDRLEVREHDIVVEELEPDSYDGAHARALLEHLPDRAKAIEHTVRALRRGGWLLAEDVAFPPPHTAPELPVLTKVSTASEVGFRAAGADPYYGLQLPADLAAGGLVDVACHARVPIVSSGTPMVDFVALSLEHLRSRFESAGLLTADEVDEALAALRKPGCTLLGPIMVAAWGQKPS
jgi:SAM-dependent methyltransferase